MSPAEGDGQAVPESTTTAPAAEPPAQEPAPPAATAAPEPAPASTPEPAAAAPTPVEPVAPVAPVARPAPDRPVTAEVLRSAAGSPAEVKEILKEEALRGRARAEAAALRAASAKAPSAPARVTRSSSSARLVRPAAATPAAPAPRPVQAPPAVAPAPAPVVVAPPPLAPQPPRAPVAPATPVAPAQRPAGANRAGGGRGTRIVLPAARNLPFAAALLGQGLLIMMGMYWIGRRVERAVAERPVAPPVSPPPVITTPAQAPASGPGGLVELGQGRAMLLAPDGRVLVLQADPVSGELRLERVYELVHDADRHLGTPLRRPHGYYLEDVERGAEERVAAAREKFERVVKDAAEARGLASLDDAEEAALGLVVAGGADLLFPLLDPVGAERADAVRKHAAALALGRGGYLVAVEPLAALLEQNRASERYAPRLKKLLSGLIGRPEVEALPPEEVVDIARAWAQTHPPGERPIRAPR